MEGICDHGLKIEKNVSFCCLDSTVLKIVALDLCEYALFYVSWPKTGPKWLDRLIQN